MRSLARTFRSRLLPALLTASGVTLLAAGLLNYGGNVQASPFGATPTPSGLGTRPSPAFVGPSLPPVDGSAPPRVAPSPDPNRVATRVVIDQLGIDLPIVAQ